jgi:uncharacterized Zn-finger protein
MAIRTTSDTVVFRHPFRLAGQDGTQAAGRYLVETDEELIESLSFTAYRRVATYIHLPGRAGKSIQVVGIDPTALAAMLMGDIEAEAYTPPGDRSMTRGAAEFMPGRLPEFRNDHGAAEIRIGARAFHCTGASPPQDHPHVYLDMGSRDAILCPYCATLFRFDAQPGSSPVEPSEWFDAGHRLAEAAALDDRDIDAWTNEGGAGGRTA